MPDRHPYAHLLAPLSLGSLRLRNRVMMGSMHTRLDQFDRATERQVAFYAERARGEVGLIVTGGFSPNREGRLEEEAPVLETSAQARALRPIVQAVHAEGTGFLLQILHAGRYAAHDQLVGASAIASPINPRKPDPLTPGAIERTIEDYVRCAELAAEAGFDGVEVMGSEGYLINQFTAPRTNDRTDEWGGPLENRMRLATEIVARTRARLGPDFVIMFRISAIDLVEGGLTAREIETQARAVERAGASLINTGIGWHEARVPTIAYMVPRGAWRFAAARVKRAVGIPVVASNRISTPELAESILAGGDADLVSMARPLLADPAFVAKVRRGESASINTCIACNQACLDYIFSQRVATCLVNPRAGRELEFATAPAARPQRVAVVGAGAAGLACATTAAARGHQVTLFESQTAIGGQLNLARRVPGKQEFDELLRWFQGEIVRHRVDVRLGVEADTDLLAAGGYERVVIATGVVPRAVGIPGIDHPSVLTYPEALLGTRAIGARVAIIGAGGIGFDVAETLTRAPAAAGDDALARFQLEWGVDPSIAAPGGLARGDEGPPARRVWVLQRRTGRPGDRLGVSTGWILRNSLKRRQVQMLTDCSYERIDDAGLHLRVEGKAMTLPVDTVVICAGQERNHALADALATRRIAADVIGGAERAQELDALRAIDQGVRLALSL
jgi:2,4-dienoyl-CoA reductase (NADPH2)